MTEKQIQKNNEIIELIDNKIVSFLEETRARQDVEHTLNMVCAINDLARTKKILIECGCNFKFVGD